MDIQLIMLGTGNAMVTKCYNTCFAIKNGTDCFMVDAGGGNGILRQLERADIPYAGIRGLIVTHGHTDHVLGAIWMIRKISMLMLNNKYQGEFTVYCHDEVANILETLCEKTLPGDSRQVIGSRLQIREVTDGEKISLIGMDIQFFDIASTKAKQFGFRASLPGGKTLVCLGDEPYNEANKAYVEHCDWLLSEAFCLYEDRDIFTPYAKNHSTALDAGKLAERLKVKKLVLYHTEDTNLAERKIRYSREAKSVFTGEVFVPDDLERIIL